MIYAHRLTTPTISESHQMKSSHPILGKISAATFLKKYWQKKPLLIRNAFNPVPDIVTADELAGMACDKRIESRLIIEKGGKTPWETQRGPFKPSLFAKLPKTKWTFLVNGADRFLPSVHAVLDQFSFIPFWRVDDVMFSYAVDKGNVGAHVDNYDVFLVQIHGTREWHIEDRAVLEDNFKPNLPIRLLKKFKATHTWILNPGDMLYLPPRFPHHGIARGDDCITMSVGFRAPSYAELIDGVTSAALSAVDEKLRYTDPDLTEQHPGEISPHSVNKFEKVLKEQLLNRSFLEEWLGRSVSETYPDVTIEKAQTVPTSKQLLKMLSTTEVVRAEGVRMAFIRKGKSEVDFYCAGEKHTLTGISSELGVLLSGRIVIPGSEVAVLVKNSSAMKLFLSLVASGYLLLD